MKKELFLLLVLSLLILASGVFSQNETTSEENTTTTLEESQTLVTEENKTEGLKTLLSDCSEICTNKEEGCACVADCEKKETVYGSNCGKKTTTTPAQPVVSLCEGCSTDDTDNPCLEVGTQKQEADGTMLYCSTNKKLETAKEAGENCNNNYECLTYTCNEGICFEELKEEDEGKSSQIILIIAAILIVLGLIFFTLKILSAKKTVVQGEKKIEKKGFEIQEPEQKYTYRYRPEFDVLEKQLKESLKTKK